MHQRIARAEFLAHQMRVLDASHKTKKIESSDWRLAPLIEQLLAVAQTAWMPPTFGDATAFLDQAQAKDSVGNSFARLEELRDRHLVRFPLGRMSLPYGFSMSFHRGKLDMLEPSVLNSCRVLWEVMQQQSRSAFSINGDQAAQTLHRFAESDPSNPLTMDDLQKRGLLSPKDSDSYVFGSEHTKENPWPSIGAQVAALHWNRINKTAGIVIGPDLVRTWLLKVSWIVNWQDAPIHLVEEDRTALLEAALQLILEEPDLLGWSRELERVSQELDSGFGKPPANYLDLYKIEEPKDLIEAHDLLRRLEFRFQISGIPQRCRGEIDGLSGMILRHDKADGGYLQRCGRIRSLVLAGIKRPHLLSLFQHSILHLRPQALAMLLAHPETAPFAMTFLAEAPFPDDGGGDAWEARCIRSERRKQALWEDALDLFHLTLEGIGNPEAKAAAVQPVLRTLGNQAILKRSRDPAQAQQTKGAWARLDLTLRTLLARGFFLNLVPELCRQLSMPSTPFVIGFATVPVAEMKVLGWLIAPPGYGRGPEGLLMRQIAAGTLVQLYLGAFLKEKNEIDGGSIIWLDDHPEVATLPWGAIFRTLPIGGDQDRLLHPTNWAELVQRLSTVVPDSETERASRLIGAWSNKARLHLRILLAAHSDVSEPLLKSSLESAITDLLVQAALSPPLGLGLLAPQYGMGPDTKDLLHRIFEGLNRFEPEQRITLVRQWIGATDDVGLLLAALGELVSEEARTFLQAQLEKFNFDASLERLNYFPHFERLAENALYAGKLPLVEQVLSHGDEIVKGRGYESDWAVFAFGIRLQLAYFNKDLQGLEALEPPPSAIYRISYPQDSKDFYRALLLLEKDPSKSAEIFWKLHQKNPDRSPNLINLFAARLRIAEALEEGSTRRDAFLEALSEWEGLEPLIPEAERPHLEKNIFYNRLFALEGARSEVEFDGLWSRLGSELKYRPEFLRLRLGNLKRRGSIAEGSKVFSEAVAYHDVEGDQPPELEEISKEFGIPGKVMTPTFPQTELPREPGLGQYQIHYHSILELDPISLIKVISPRLENPEKFLVREHALAGEELLRRAAGLLKIDDENKINDLLISLLTFRLDMIRWTVLPSNRGGATAAIESTHGGVSIRDWVIRRGTRDLMIVEAFRIHNDSWRGSLESHLRKATSRYDPTGLGSILMVAYLEHRPMLDLLEPYQAHVKSIALEGWQLKSTSPVGPEELPDLSPLRNIKVLRSRYVRGDESLIVHHLLLDLTPALNPTPD